ncbi:MAG: RecQ family ATP-dependent DNA helicase [Sterolibacteriaceae bacterium]|uniref:RecQ family ATP-dependent DNA helicase n=1 Tax=Candidatus Methylophosphatis roskildensis TaxID=2899263 RepID=A0A9D7E5I0_9PROT|nr:RecQ family ATP-dependent DNA helicase [Candidatus Methylophosphatis roskildensis]
MNEPERTSPDGSVFSPRCLSIDLEVGIRDARIHGFGAIRGDTDATCTYRSGDLSAALRRLDELSVGAAFLLGHNLIAFDLPHLMAAKPDLALLRLPAVDTLRLNPLAFPRNPYHHLVKHYQDGQLKRGRLNDPELDARLTLELFRDQQNALRELDQAAPRLVLAWHWLTTAADGASNSATGINSFFTTLRRKPRPTDRKGRSAVEALLKDRTCMTHGRDVVADAANQGWALAYALAWLSVSGGNSVMPPWVRHQFPEAGALIKRLRDTACSDPSCAWCAEKHDARAELKRWFGFDAFRPEPAGPDGSPMQQAIVDAAMRGKHVLGILPTGTGKSVCYQVPALSRYDKTGALTVVISPLVALMADQVAGLEARGISSCAAINGLLSMPERADVLDRVRLGDLGILIVSPEQLRNRTLRKALAQREIGAWVVDEAHCISKWGHDFRPDYRYVGRFIREKAGNAPIAPVLCLTATAKPDVMADIVAHFQDKVGIHLEVFDGGASRTNLEFAVVPTSGPEKFSHVFQVLEKDLPDDKAGGAIVYCASRRQAEDVSTFLSSKGIAAGHFHAGLPPETRKSVQQRFIRGELRVIAATNAFGMGIDKPDVRLVIHADIPGSLENYLQEAGRAGRDRQTARCVLLYTPDDVERQFGMSARSRLTQPEIQAIMKSLRRLDRRKRMGGEVIATAGEILAEEEDGTFQRDSATDDTRVRTAIAWLEEAVLLTRDENRVQVFPSSLRVASVEEARSKLAKASIANAYRTQLASLADALISADPDDGISTDELMLVSGLSAEKVRAALFDLERLGIASNDTALTAFVHAGVERSSSRRLASAAALEVALIEILREAAPDLGKGESSVLQLRRVAQALKEAGHPDALIERIWRILRSLAADGRNEDGGIGSLRLRRLDAESASVTLQRDWHALETTALLRRTGAERLLDHLLARLPERTRGTDLLAETTLGNLLHAIEDDLILKAEVRDFPKLLDRALLWLHEQEVVRLNKGLSVFRPAMTIHLSPEQRGFAKADYAPLRLHYHEQVVQIHVMAEYVQRGLTAMADALRLAMDYFSLKREQFIQRWLPGREKDLERQTTPASWRAIVESLNNPRQQRIVADDRERTNVLVLAGPGSGKTRVLVHRIAYLVRVCRENPRGILALAYNRHAAVEIRRRLAALIGDDAKGVTVLTCHALAMRLAGVSFVGRAEKVDDEAFKRVIQQAVALLKGDGLAPDEADEQRDRLLSGFRWILVDEYQDIGPEQYELISALAGRTSLDEEGKLSLFAVGDDDQNIYAFDGASVEFIRRFETDYAAKASYLTENYRSSASIIAAANLMIAPALDRMKADKPITIDRARNKEPAGGTWAQIDRVAQGRVQILPAGSNTMSQAVAVMSELRRLASVAPGWNWAKAAVISRDWRSLEPMRSFCELHQVPAQVADEDAAQFWRLRETQALVSWLRYQPERLVDAESIAQWLDAQPARPWWDLLRQAFEDYLGEIADAELPTEHCLNWLAEWGREARRRQKGLLLLTAHRAKGLEFDHVVVLGGGWERIGRNEDRDAPRRLYYVAMTRARQTLTLARLDDGHALLDSLPENPDMLERPPTELAAVTPELARQYRRPSMREIDLGYPGRRERSHAIHRAISGLLPGDPLNLARVGERWMLHDRNGETIGQLARAYLPPSGMTCIAARVAAVVVRKRDDGDPEYRDRIRCDTWEIVLPELVFEPVRQAPLRRPSCNVEYP